MKTSKKNQTSDYHIVFVLIIFSLPPAGMLPELNTNKAKPVKTIAKNINSDHTPFSIHYFAHRFKSKNNNQTTGFLCGSRNYIELCTKCFAHTHTLSRILFMFANTSINWPSDKSPCKRQHTNARANAICIVGTDAITLISMLVASNHSQNCLCLHSS